MEGFTVGLALVDAIPVLSFGIGSMMIASRFDSPLFWIGAVLCVLAGCCKVTWKLVLGIWKKDLRWLNKPFGPAMGCGFLIMILGIVLGFQRISWSAVGAAIVGLPGVIFFGLWLVGMGAMVWYKKTKFKNDDAKSNWTAQIINAAAQTCLLLGILFAN